MSYSVYVLKAIGNKLRYVGFTSKNVHVRVKEHNSSKNKYTKRYKWELNTTKKVIVGNVLEDERSFWNQGKGEKLLI